MSITVESKLKSYSDEDLSGVSGQIDRQVLRLAHESVRGIGENQLLGLIGTITENETHPLTENDNWALARSFYNIRRIDTLGVLKRRVDLEVALRGVRRR